jgi:Tfp pilus assembly protein PilF
LQRAQQEHPSEYWLTFDLANALNARNRWDEAIGYFRAALAVRPKSSAVYNNLGTALRAKGDLDGAIAHYQKALALNPQLASAHFNLGLAVSHKGDLDGAITHYKRALDLDPQYAPARTNLGNALRDRRDLDGAITQHRKAIEADEQLAPAHNNLGNALRDKGRFADALAAYRRFQKLASQHSQWKKQAAAQVREAEALVQLDARLPAVLRGEVKASDAEQLGFAVCCQHKRLYRASAGFYQAAFTAQPRLADDPRMGHRYNAACVAALASCRRGEDADACDDPERVRWRRQALDWLRAELKEQTKQILAARPRDSARIQKTLRDWQRDPYLGGVRDPAALAQLSDAERDGWRILWADVERFSRLEPIPH